MTNDNSQIGVLAPIPALGRSLTFRLLPETKSRHALHLLRDNFDPNWGVIAFGFPLVRVLDRTIPGLRGFAGMAGVGYAVPSTQQAMWVMLRGDNRGELFDRTEYIKSMVVDALNLDDATDTFRYREGRDLTGYEDGTENPQHDDARAAALIGAGTQVTGASFVAVQRWAHDLERFKNFLPDQRDNIIGRRVTDNEEIDTAPETAHVKRTAQENFNPAAFMVRRSMPWANGLGQGLEFVAYVHSLDTFEVMLKKMAGLEDGIVDALFSFSRPVTGGYYWCPPIVHHRLDLRALL